MLHAADPAGILIPEDLFMHVFLPAEILCDDFHPVCLSHMERAPAVAVAAGNAVGSLFLQLGIMVCRHIISYDRQIIILVYQSHIEARRARLTVVAVNARPFRIFWREAAYDGIIPFLIGSFQKIPVGLLYPPYCAPPAGPSGRPVCPERTGYTDKVSAPVQMEMCQN